MGVELAGIVAVVCLAAAVLGSHQLSRLSRDSICRFESFAAGIAAGYVFLLILPKLSSQQATLEAAVSHWRLMEYVYDHAYLMALLGFAAYYFMNLRSAAGGSALRWRARSVSVAAALALYAGLVGELVAAKASSGATPMLLFVLALALHLSGLSFVVYERVADSWSWLRWVLVASLVLGWFLGIWAPLPVATTALLSAFLGGAMILHVVDAELPDTRRPVAFAIGATTFGLLLKLSILLGGVEGGV